RRAHKDAEQVAARRGFDMSRVVHAILVVPLVLCAACTLHVYPTVTSLDPAANYAWVFGDLPLGETTVLNSRLYRVQPDLFGIPLGEENGNWEFELMATPAWLAVVQPNFTEVLEK